ncbi:Predicted arabinose efflux permease, MFS family [Lentzea xinjiangensis]|uniref:Predicted arabinose efflux permease, MFS family n=1 Tax=Lentzea xinjiangensis TaxID=402600 RepID=A0A1H9F6Y3_9PSEU|nr:MFS transporter [Lentzea xinjiangensis]SEQ33726.1 Predicted arabinose efflux permease, MFS family [Lentzea xinjiangensis]
MDLAPFKHVLMLPGVRPLALLMFFARMPPAATGVVLTLHVAVTLDRGYAAAGLVGAAGTIGMGLGAPLMGRLIDERGLRSMLALSVTASAAFWLTAPLLGYWALLVCSFGVGLLGVPMMSIGRQVITALVPQSRRRVAMSVDSISVELSFMVGPALGVFAATKFSTNAALLSIGGSILVAGVLLYWANPPMVHEDEVVGGPKPRIFEWLRGRIVGVLVVCAGATVCLAGMEVSAIASLEHIGKQSWLGVVFFAMCAASIVGGLVYGGVKRAPSVLVLLVLMALLEIPVGLGDGNVLLLCLLLVPMNLMCAPLIAASGEHISRLAPSTARGLALGLQGSAFTVGNAIGAPIAGAAIDRAGAPAGFVVAGAAGLVVAGIAGGLARKPVADRVTMAP